MLLCWLGETVTHTHRGNLTPALTGGIKLLERSGEFLQPNCLYIGEPETIKTAILNGRLSPEGNLILASGSGRPVSEVCELPKELNLIESSLPLLSLYNRIQERIHRFRLWNTQLQEVVYTNGGLQRLLERAYEEIHATILLVNNGYKHIASVYCPEVSDPTADELLENGFQSIETIHAIQHEAAIRQGGRKEFAEYISRKSNNYTIVQLIYHQGDLVARLCVILNGPTPDPCRSDLTAILARYIQQYMFSHQGADYGNNSAFGSLVSDLIECRLTDPEELKQRLQDIRLAVRRYYHVMLIGIDDTNNHSNIPWNYMINQLEYIFPLSNITTYQGDILLLIRKTKRGSRLTFRQEDLMAILERYNGYAAISNTSEYLTSLPPIYHQTKDALRLGMAMDPKTRIYFYEDYSIYQIIELAAQAARHDLGSRNMVHLCNNEIISLVMYDNKNHTNLVEVLYTYLLHERNTTEAAQALYIHRNTMLYKLHKIREIIGDRLDDPLFRERYLFSYRVLDYMNRYRKEDIMVLKQTPAEKTPLPTGDPSLL